MNIIGAIEDNIAEEDKVVKDQQQDETLEESEGIVDEALSKEEEATEENEEVKVEEEPDGLEEGEVQEEKDQELEEPEENKRSNQAFAEMRRENSELRERMARMEGANEVRSKQETAAKEPTDEEPDYDLDPDDWHKWDSRQKSKEISELTDRVSAQDEKMALTAFNNEWDKQSSAAETTDDFYRGARKHILDARVNQIKASNPALSDTQVNQQIKQEEYNFALQITQAGINPISFIKTKAIEGGYVHTQEAKESEPKNKGNPKKIANNKRKGKSLIGDSAASDKQKIDSDALATMSLQDKLNMSEDEWEDAI